MPPINTGSFAKALWPGVNKWYGMAYDKFPVEHSAIFDKETSSKAFEEDVSASGFGLAKQKPQGVAISYDDARQGFTTRYTHVVYGLGFIITREMFEDDQYDVIGKKRSQALAFSLRQTKEIVAANVLNRAFTAGYTGGDGVVLCSASHPNVAGGTWSNTLAVAADLSEASLEQACIDLMSFRDDRGNLISVMGDKLVIPPQLVFEATRILKSALQNDTANNATNALRQAGMFPGGIVVNHYLTDADAWFIKTNVADGLKYFERRADEFTQDNDFDTENAKYKATGRFSFGWTDPRGLYGSPGA